MPINLSPVLFTNEAKSSLRWYVQTRDDNERLSDNNIKEFMILSYMASRVLNMIENMYDLLSAQECYTSQLESHTNSSYSLNKGNDPFVLI